MSYERTYVVHHLRALGHDERLICFDVRQEDDRTASLCVVGSPTRRMITVEGVRQVADFDTGEVLAGIEQAYGAAPTLSDTDIKRIRSRDKSQWHRPYLFNVIENHFRNKLFELFAYRCFNCGRPGKIAEYASMEHVPFWRGLDRDHHIPINLGGRLVPGNVVVLCATCNGRKHEKDPRAFYSIDQLTAVQPLLNKEADVLAFKFNPARWGEDRRGYLMSLGIGEQLVEQVLNNENHRYYLGKGGDGREPIAFAITVSGISELLEKHSKGRGEP